MRTLEIPLRYYSKQRTAYITEKDFVRRTQVRQVGVHEIALVLVDVWSDHYVKTHLDRGREITLGCIRPVMDAFREIGAAVIHAPSPGCAKKYGQWLQYAGDREVHGGSAGPSDEWPPAVFRSKSGDYAQWALPPEEENDRFKEINEARSIIPEVAPEENDYVIVNGDQLHRLLKHQKILHLFYAGFAANMCVPFRDYGMRAMKDRGYDIALVRDCTTAIEVAETADDLSITRACVIDVELNIGFTVSSEELLDACRAGGGD